MAQNRRLQDLQVNEVLQAIVEGLDPSEPRETQARRAHLALLDPSDRQGIQDLLGLRVLQARGRPVLQGLIPR